MLLRLGVLAVLVLVAVTAAAPAHAARSADARTVRALSAATARWSATDSLALDRRGRLVENTGYGTTQELTRRGFWVSALDRRWARVIVRTTRDDRVSTVLRRKGGRWRALASGGFGGRDGDRRDGAQCSRSRIPRLVAVDLGLGDYAAFDPAGRCQGPESRRRRAMTTAELDAAAPTAVSPAWPAAREDSGDCVAREPVQDTPPTGYVSRRLPSWSFMHVYCTRGAIGDQAQLGLFAAVLRDGRPVERLGISRVYTDGRCWNGRGLKSMPLRARLELGLCTPAPYALMDAAR